MTEQVTVDRLRTDDRDRARETFTLMATVFDEGQGPLSDAYLERLLARADFWALSARIGHEVVGGLTGHTLWMTREEAAEVFLYDIAVHPRHQRHGVGRALVTSLRELAGAQGIDVVFVPADDDDDDALDFYRALGGSPAPVTIFDFGPD